MTGNVPNLMKEIDIQIQVQRVPNKMNPKRHTPRHIIIKISKVVWRDQEKKKKDSWTWTTVW